MENGLDFIKGILDKMEREVLYNEEKSITQQLTTYLGTLGYKNIMYESRGSFCTKEGYVSGLVFVVFLSKAAMEAYLSENEVWNKWASFHGSVMAGDQPKRPIWESIKYLDINKKK